METQQSRKKIEACNAIAAKSATFITEGCDDLKALKAATETIGVPLFDGIYNVMADTMKAGTEVVHSACEELAGMCKDWGSRVGFGAKAQAAFEEAEKSVKAVLSAEYVGGPCEEATGLDEHVDASTVGAFTNALIKFIEVKNNFIYGVANASNEYSTPDTEHVFKTIGSGMEKFTNAIVDAIDNNKAELAKFGVSLEEINKAVNAKASNAAEVSAAKARRTSSQEAIY